MGRDNCYESEIKRFQRDIKESNQFMDWLSLYSSIHERVSSLDTLSQEKISPIDKKGLSQISLLFDVIEKFAKANYIDAEKNEDGYYYFVKDRESHYIVGIDFLDGVQYYCIRNDSSPKEEINFTYVRFQQKTPNAIMIDYYLGELECHIENISSRGVPLEEIQNRSYKTVRKIRTKKYEKRS